MSQAIYVPFQVYRQFDHRALTAVSCISPRQRRRVAVALTPISGAPDQLTGKSGTSDEVLDSPHKLKYYKDGMKMMCIRAVVVCIV